MFKIIKKENNQNVEIGRANWSSFIGWNHGRVLTESCNAELVAVADLIRYW